MTLLRTSLFVAAAAALSACANVETASRNAPYQAQPSLSAVDQQTETAQLRVASYSIKVPNTLTVSEANAYYPKGDIVWRGDPMGNRYEQVEAIFDDSLSRSASSNADGYPVNVHIEVVRFHALTEKARYTVGGVHAITFKMQIIDPKTNELMTEPRLVEADLEAFGGKAAIEAEARGHTQKARITAHLAEVMRQELTRKSGYINERLGFYQAVNKL